MSPALVALLQTPVNRWRVEDINWDLQEELLVCLTDHATDSPTFLYCLGVARYFQNYNIYASYSYYYYDYDYSYDEAISVSKLLNLAMAALENIAPRLLYSKNDWFYQLSQFYCLYNDRRVKPRVHTLVRNLLSGPALHDEIGLLWLLNNLNDPALRKLAVTQLQKLNLKHLDQLARLWTTRRYSEVEKLLLDRPWQNLTDLPTEDWMLLRLKVGQIPPLEELNSRQLAFAVKYWNDADPAIAANALALLKACSTNDLERVAIMIIQNPNIYYIPRTSDDPNSQIEQLKIKLFLLTENLQPLGWIEPTELSYLLELLEGNDPPWVRQNVLSVLGQLQEPTSQAALCQVVIEQDLPDLTRLAFEAGYLPTKTYDKALFFFVTEQWDRYEEIDFDQSILKTAYRTASARQKQRLARLIREAGRPAYLAVINQANLTRPADLSKKESRLLVRVLEDNQEWDKLWKMVGDLPIKLTTQAIQKLVTAGWQPANPDEQADFKKFKALVKKPLQLDSQTIQQSLPLAQRQALDWKTLLDQPMAQARPEQLGWIIAFRQRYLVPDQTILNTLDWLEAILRYHFRHTVELAAPDQEPGEFDIEIEVIE